MTCAAEAAPAAGLGNDDVNVRVALKSVEDVDDQAVERLREAHRLNC